MNQKDLIKTENIIKISPEITLSSALSNLSSSHDAAFVFKEDKYIGIINPYYTLIQTSYPGTTKVEHCLFHPPRVYMNDTVERIAQLMAESKVHFLPVMDDKQKFIGITSARRLLREIKKMPIAKTNILEVAEGKNGGLISVYEDDTIEEAMQLFKSHKISKLVVIDKNMKLQGILSYNEMTPYLAAPGPGEKENRWTQKKEKQHLMNMKVKNYSIKTVLTSGPEITVADAIDSMATHGMGSIVIVDKESHPLGIVTTKDIMNLLRPKKIKKSVLLTTKNLSPIHEKTIDDFVSYVSSHIQPKPEIRSAKVIVEEEKNGVIFRLAVHIEPEKGNVEVFEREEKDLAVIIKEFKKFIRGGS